MNILEQRNHYYNLEFIIKFSIRNIQHAFYGLKINIDQIKFSSICKVIWSDWKNGKENETEKMSVSTFREEKKVFEVEKRLFFFLSISFFFSKWKSNSLLFLSFFLSNLDKEGMKELYSSFLIFFGKGWRRKRSLFEVCYIQGGMSVVLRRHFSKSRHNINL